MASSLFAFVRTKSSGVHLSSAFTTAAWRDNVTCLRSMFIIIIIIIIIYLTLSQQIR
jgi:hypothetical protein